jgi:ankyrin repeat protein
MRTAFLLILSATITGCLQVATPSPLGAAAAANRADDVRRLLAGGESADQFGPGGTTPLIDAARANALASMAVLLDAGADPNRRDARSRGWTALMHAVDTRHADAVRLLLDRGSDPNIPSILIPREAEPEHPHGGLPLLMAVMDDDPTFVSLLLAHGANPRADGHDGAVVLTTAVSGRTFDETDAPPVVLAVTMLEIASRGGCHREAVRALLAHDPELKLGRAYRPASQARIVGRWNCGDLLALVDR